MFGAPPAHFFNLVGPVLKYRCSINFKNSNLLPVCYPSTPLGQQACVNQCVDNSPFRALRQYCPKTVVLYVGCYATNCTEFADKDILTYV